MRGLPILLFVPPGCRPCGDRWLRCHPPVAPASVPFPRFAARVDRQHPPSGRWATVSMAASNAIGSRGGIRRPVSSTTDDFRRAAGIGSDDCPRGSHRFQQHQPQPFAIAGEYHAVRRGDDWTDIRMKTEELYVRVKPPLCHQFTKFILQRPGAGEE